MLKQEKKKKNMLKRNSYLESGSRNSAIMMVANTMHMRYMVLISNISESGGLSRLSSAWFPITQKFEPHNRNSSSDSIELLSPLPPPWAPLDNTVHKRAVPLYVNNIITIIDIMINYSTVILRALRLTHEKCI